MYKAIRILKIINKNSKYESWTCVDAEPKDEDDKNSKFDLFFSPNGIKKGDLVEAKPVQFSLFKSEDFNAIMKRGSDLSTKPHKFFRMLKK